MPDPDKELWVDLYRMVIMGTGDASYSQGELETHELKLRGWSTVAVTSPAFTPSKPGDR